MFPGGYFARQYFTPQYFPGTGVETVQPTYPGLFADPAFYEVFVGLF